MGKSALIVRRKTLTASPTKFLLLLLTSLRQVPSRVVQGFLYSSPRTDATVTCAERSPSEISGKVLCRLYTKCRDGNRLVQISYCILSSNSNLFFISTFGVYETYMVKPSGAFFSLCPDVTYFGGGWFMLTGIP